MSINELPKITERSAKRLGRGMGSGKGSHTSSRGSKGQKARGKVAIQFEGTKIKKSFVKRLPFLRGKGKFKPLKSKKIILNLGDFEKWPEKTEVTIANLIKNGYVGEGCTSETVKILANGEVEQALTIRVTISKSAAQKVTQAGGKIVGSNE